MSSILDSTTAAQAKFLPTMRELFKTYQIVSASAEQHIRQLGLTLPQFDVIATLGNTSGMTMGEIAEKTLVTKGTLTGIIDRLEAKNLVKRENFSGDRRCYLVILTEAGESLFHKIFPLHISHLQDKFEQLSSQDLEELQILLSKLRNTFN